MLLNGAKSPDDSGAASRARPFLRPGRPPARGLGHGNVASPTTRFSACNGNAQRGACFAINARIREHRRKTCNPLRRASGEIDARAGKLSGGNLQKLILGREIMRGAAALIVEQPTRGLDVGAVESVWRELLARTPGRQGDPADLRGTRRAAEPRRPDRRDVRGPHHGHCRCGERLRRKSWAYDGIPGIAACSGEAMASCSNAV